MIPFWNPQDQGNVLGSISRHHVYPQDDLEAQECPLTGDLVEIGCLDGGFAILISHIIPHIDYILELLDHPDGQHDA